MEEKTFSLSVTEQELNIISAGLTELPFKVVASLIQKLQGQINAGQTGQQDAMAVEEVAV